MLVRIVFFIIHHRGIAYLCIFVINILLRCTILYRTDFYLVDIRWQLYIFRDQNVGGWDGGDFFSGGTVLPSTVLEQTRQAFCVLVPANYSNIRYSYKNSFTVLFSVVKLCAVLCGVVRMVMRMLGWFTKPGIG